MKLNIRLVTVVLVGLFLAVGLAWAQGARSGPIHRSPYHNLLGDSIGVSGYDPVAYFPEGGSRAQKGLIRLTFEYKGVTYRFASEENRERFKAGPEKYLPAFGGWCAWAMGELGKKVDVDPESFEIRDGRLYLFYRDHELDTRALWQKNPEELRRKANTHWESLARER
jgi:YHS domain-containing protein